MGTGARYERAAYGQALGEARAIQQHQLAMIPIMREQAEVELEIQEQKYAMDIKQTEKLNLLAQQLQPDPVLVPSDVTQKKSVPKNLFVYAGLAALAFIFLRKK